MGKIRPPQFSFGSDGCVEAPVLNRIAVTAFIHFRTEPVFSIRSAPPRVGCDVRTVEGAKRGGERPASSQLLSARNGMAREAPAGVHEIFAARHGVCLGYCRGLLHSTA